MSTKKLFGIFVGIVILCVGALLWLLTDKGPDAPVIGDESIPQTSGENVNPGIEIVLSGDESGENFEENEDANINYGTENYEECIGEFERIAEENIKCVQDENKVIVTTGKEQAIIYYYKDDKIVAKESYIRYSSPNTAKVLAETYNSESYDKSSLKNVKDVKYSGNYLIMIYDKAGFEVDSVKVLVEKYKSN